MRVYKYIALGTGCAHSISVDLTVQPQNFVTFVLFFRQDHTPDLPTLLSQTS